MKKDNTLLLAGAGLLAYLFLSNKVQGVANLVGTGPGGGPGGGGGISLDLGGLLGGLGGPPTIIRMDPPDITIPSIPWPDFPWPEVPPGPGEPSPTNFPGWPSGDASPETTNPLDILGRLDELFVLLGKGGGIPTIDMPDIPNPLDILETPGIPGILGLPGLPTGLIGDKDPGRWAGYFGDFEAGLAGIGDIYFDIAGGWQERQEVPAMILAKIGGFLFGDVKGKTTDYAKSVLESRGLPENATPADLAAYFAGARESVGKPVADSELSYSVRTPAVSESSPSLPRETSFSYAPRRQAISIGNTGFKDYGRKQLSPGSRETGRVISKRAPSTYAAWEWS